MTRKLFAVATAFTFAFSFLPASAQQGLAQSGPSMQAEQPAATSPHGEDVVSLGDLHLFGFFTRETPPNARNAGGFLSIHNHGGDDRLISASSPVAQRVELHTMTMDGDVMRMRQLENGIEVPADTLVELAPGGLHVMFIDIEEAFSQGQMIPVTLTFETSGSVDVMMPVVARSMGTAMGMDHGAHGHGHGHGGQGNTN